MHVRIFAIITVLLILPNLGMGQFMKGDKYIGVSGLPVYWLNNGNIQSYGFIAKTYLGKFVTDKMSIGLQPYYAHLSGVNTFGINIFSRYNLFARKTMVFLEGGAGFGAVSYNESSGFEDGLFAITLGPGVGYFLSKSISVEFILQYQRWTLFYESGAGWSFVPSIGAVYYLNKK